MYRFSIHALSDCGLSSREYLMTAVPSACPAESSQRAVALPHHGLAELKLLLLLRCLGSSITQYRLLRKRWPNSVKSITNTRCRSLRRPLTQSVSRRPGQDPEVYGAHQSIFQRRRHSARIVGAPSTPSPASLMNHPPRRGTTWVLP